MIFGGVVVVFIRMVFGMILVLGKNWCLLVWFVGYGVLF